jgi:hypothetical protein
MLACTDVTQATAIRSSVPGTWLGPGRVRAVRHALSAVGLVVAGYLLFVVAPTVGTFGFDAWAYWSVDPADPYPASIPIGNLGYFPYSPPVALVAGTFSALPWWIFLWLWTALLAGTLAWLGGRWALAWLSFLPVLIELYHGNVHLLLGAAVVLGFRYPWTWVLVLLTKVTPGVGLAWFAVRREWRPLLVAIGVTGGLVLASWLIDPLAWSAWLAQLGRGAPADCGMHCVPVPLLARLPVALAVAAFAGMTGRRWLVPVAAMLALPVLWLSGLSMLVAAGALVIRDRSDRREAGPS